MTQLWRINLSSDAEEGIDQRRFCLEKGILGIGWGVDCEVTHSEWDRYLEAARPEYEDGNGWWPAINAIKNRMSIGDLCWTRDWHGVYYLGRIVGHWEYHGEGEFRSADIINIRSCEWHRIGTVESVPGKVVSSFIPGRTVQRVDDPTALLFSQFLFNEACGGVLYELEATDTDLFSLLSADDMEDIVGLYLQMNGYSIVPSTCKSDTAVYECVLIHRDNGKRAVFQVKSGHTRINMDDYASIDCDVFLFSACGRYDGSRKPHIHCIPRETIEDFLNSNLIKLPTRIQRWVALSKTLVHET